MRVQLQLCMSSIWQGLTTAPGIQAALERAMVVLGHWSSREQRWAANMRVTHLSDGCHVSKSHHDIPLETDYLVVPLASWFRHSDSTSTATSSRVFIT